MTEVAGEGPEAQASVSPGIRRLLICRPLNELTINKRMKKDESEEDIMKRGREEEEKRRREEVGDCGR